MELKILEQGLTIKDILSSVNFGSWDEVQTLKHFQSSAVTLQRLMLAPGSYYHRHPRKHPSQCYHGVLRYPNTRSAPRTDILSLSYKSRVHSEL